MIITPILRKLSWLLTVILFTFPNLLLAADEDGITRIGIMLFDGVLTSDVVAPMEVFGGAIANNIVENYEVITIASQAGSIKTHEGITLHADFSIENAPELDVIIVGSSYNMDPILEDEAFMTFIRERGARADWLASNCSGAYILAEAGFLKGRRATTYPGGEVWLKLNHPSINIEINENVVVDGNVITSNGSLVSYEAALALLSQMEDEAASKAMASGIYYDRLLKGGEIF